MKKILVVDDHPLIIQGLSRELGDRFSLKGVRDSSHAREELLRGAYIACVLDVSLGKEDGLGLLSFAPVDTPVFVLSMHANPHYARRAKDAGAKGYFTKDENLSILREALEAPESRLFWCSDTMQAAMEASIGSDGSPYDSLTAREQEVFRLLAEGQNYKEIAYNLSISAKTVNVHRGNILAKLDLPSQTELVKAAVRFGVIEI